MKTVFEKFMQVASVILIPLSIAIGGHLFGLQLKNAEIQSQERRFRTEHDLELARQEADWKITKSELVFKFMDALTSADDIERKLAVEAVMIALPEDGPRIAQIVARSDPDQGVQNSASNSISKQINRIINEMFGEEKQQRIKATELAVSGWQNNDEFIAAVLSKAMRNIGNADGVWNAVIYLENNQPDILANHRQAIMNFRSALAEMKGRNNTLRRLEKNVLEKLQ